jgi:hypothetical protein
MPDTQPEHGIPSAILEQDIAEYDLLDDCRMMLRFAVKEGVEPDDSLQSNIAALDALLCEVPLSPISEVPAKLLTGPAEKTKNNIGSAPAERQKVIELVLKVHAGLAKLVSPATPETLRATQPPPGRQRLLGGMPLIVKGTIYAALVCLLGFLVTVPKPPPRHETSSTPTPSPSPSAAQR